jgi:histidyl-tRNA synthetase
LLDKAPSIEDFINEDSKKFNMKFLEILETHGIEYEVNPKLVRGLDYYNQTVFEWKTDLLGSQDTILGGGRYDNLVEELGGKSCPAIGFSIGLERLILLLKDRDKINIESNLDIYFICFSQSSAEEAIMYSEKLKNKFPSLRIKTNLGLESASSQFKKADKSGAKIALILGEEELDSKKISFKDLRTKSNQESLTFDELINKLEI